MNIGKIIRRYRREKGMTPQEMAEELRRRLSAELLNDPCPDMP